MHCLTVAHSLLFFIHFCHCTLVHSTLAVSALDGFCHPVHVLRESNVMFIAAKTVVLLFVSSSGAIHFHTDNADTYPYNKFFCAVSWTRAVAVFVVDLSSV